MELKRRDSTDGVPEDSGQEPKPEPEKKSPGVIRKREISVIIYTTVLFFVALVLILISYFIQERTNSTLSNLSAQHGELTAQALQNIEELQKRNQELSDELDNAEDELSDAEARLEAADREMESLLAEQAGLEQANEAAELEKQSLEAELQAQRGKTEALGLLTALLSSPEGTDVSAILTQLEAKKGNLDPAFLEIYNTYIENMNKEGGRK